jgi:hypothetical protein
LFRRNRKPNFKREVVERRLMMKRKVLSILVIAGLLIGLLVVPAQAATDEEIEDTIKEGVAWLAGQQNEDGSWGQWEWNRTAITGMVLVKLQERAGELDFESPFDPDYEYSDEIIKGWKYVFTMTRTLKQALSLQDHTVLPGSGTIDNPDTNGNGYGVYFGPGQINYNTGICLMALAASGTPNRPNDGGLDLNGDGSFDTFGEIAQDTVDWMAFAQSDGGPQEGGWSYGPCDNGNCWADQSNSGYSVLGLAYGELFGCTVPDWVAAELNVWVSNIQRADGGSDYDGTWGSSNLLRTGNLIFQMKFCGDAPSTPRFQSALAYIEAHWRDANFDPGWGYSTNPANYQAMYCLMKGLGYSGIELIDTDGDGVRDDSWLKQEPSAAPPQDFSSVIVQQGPPWQDPYYTGDPIMGTAWALLTLEFVFPDIIPPVVECVEAVNPHGNNVPGGKANGKGQGVNPDGFYKLFAEDNRDPEPIILVLYWDPEATDPDGNLGWWVPLGDKDNPDQLFVLLSGTVVKFTEAPGATPSYKKIGSTKGQAGAVAWHITLPSEPVVLAVDDSGNWAAFPCFVPPPPK